MIFFVLTKISAARARGTTNFKLELPAVDTRDLWDYFQVIDNCAR